MMIITNNSVAAKLSYVCFTPITCGWVESACPNPERLWGTSYNLFVFRFTRFRLTFFCGQVGTYLVGACSALLAYIPSAAVGTTTPIVVRPARSQGEIRHCNKGVLSVN